MDIPTQYVTDRRRYLTAVGAGLLGSAGCVDPDDEIGPIDSERVIWSYEAGPKMLTKPLLFNGNIHVGSIDSYLYAIDASSGEHQWQFGTDHKIWSSPKTDGERIIFGSFDGRCYALRPDGTKSWDFQTGGRVIFDTVVIEKEVCIPDTDGQLYLVSSQTGKERWSSDLGGAVSTTPTFADNKLYVEGGNYDLFEVRFEDGQSHWLFDVGKNVNTRIGISAGLVLFGTQGNTFYALSRETGEIEWTIQTGDWCSGLLTNGNSVYFGDHTDRLRSVEIDSGDVEWNIELPGRVEGGPTISNGVLYLGDTEGFLHAIDPDTGDINWQIKSEGGIYASPTIVNDVAYIASWDHYVYKIDVS